MPKRPFRSTLNRIPVIDRSDHPLTFVKEKSGTGRHSRGLRRRNFRQQPFGSLPFASRFDVATFDEQECRERIEDLERNKARIPDLCDYYGLKVKNQASTNYCWINAPVHAVEVTRCVQHQQYVELSPASCGAKIKNFRNVGGWGTEAMEYLVSDGAVPTSLWPANAISRNYDTSAANAERAKYQVDEWWELTPKSIPELRTAILLGFPVCIGLNWWSHEITVVALVIMKDGHIGYMIDNSWGTNWGNNGRGILTEAKARPDDACTPRVVTASGKAKGSRR